MSLYALALEIEEIYMETAATPDEQAAWRLANKSRYWQSIIDPLADHTNGVLARVRAYDRERGINASLPMEIMQQIVRCHHEVRTLLKSRRDKLTSEQIATLESLKRGIDQVIAGE